MSPALGAPTAQRRQTTLRFEGRLGLSGLPPPEFGSPTGGLSPCHGSQALCRPERRLRRLPAIGPLASANRSPWLQELIRHCTRIYCCLPRLKISTRRYWCNQPRARSFTLVSAPRIHGPRETAARRSRCPHHRDRSGAPSDRCRIARFDRAGLLEQRAVARNDAIRALF